MSTHPDRPSSVFSTPAHLVRAGLARTGTAAVALALACSAVGCASTAEQTTKGGVREMSAPAPRAQGTTPEPPTETPPADAEDVGFADGEALPAGTDIGWADGLVADAGWSSIPSEHPGRWSYASASGRCTAAFRGGILGDAGGMDDAEATDALIEHQAGEHFIGADLLSDGRFLRYEHGDAGVAHRQFSYTVNEFGFFMAARAFVKTDYAVWVTVTCEGEPVGPVAQEVLSKNLIAVTEPQG